MDRREEPGVPRLRGYHCLTLGCKANQYDTASMAADLEAAGLVPVGEEEAQLLVINTCVVTGSSEAQCRQAIRRARRRNPGARLVVAGCMAASSRAVLEGMAEVDLVLEPGDKGRLTSLLGLTAAGGWRDWRDQPAVELGGRDRAFLKVQDGCDHRCSYCIVPLVRGSSRSLPPRAVEEAVRRLEAEGRGEVVLTGIHLGLYGRDLAGGGSLEGLLELLLARPGGARIRLSSMEPLELGEGLLEHIASSGGRLCRHLHIPLQSGSDRILELMNRPYRSADFSRVVREARRRIPGVGIGCDIIAGFPGEGEEEFIRTLELVRSLAIPFVHAFPYSPRPGTEAARLKDSVPPPEKKERVRLLREAAKAGREAFLDSLVGQRLQVVPEGRRDGRGRVMALADNYARVLLEGSTLAPPGSLLTVPCRRREGEALVAGEPDG